MRSPFVVFFALIVGIIILAGYFFPSPALAAIRTPMLDWAVTLSGVAGLVAILQLIFGVHWKRLRQPEKNRFFSIIVILSFILTLGAGIFFGPNHEEYKQVVTSIQMPIEASMMAVLAVTLAYASLRLLQRQRNWMGFVFFVSVIVYLLLNSGIFSFAADLPMVRDSLSLVKAVPIAGARGILIGVAIGSLLTGIRILLGAEKPYNG